MAKLNQFVDISHAVCIVECQERHFKAISKVLDDMKVPAGVGEGPFTVLQRVQTLAGASTFKKISKGQLEKAARIVASLPEEEPIDPEDLLEQIGTETFEERLAREGVTKDVANDTGDTGRDEPCGGSASELVECDISHAGSDIREGAVSTKFGLNDTDDNSL